MSRDYSASQVGMRTVAERVQFVRFRLQFHSDLKHRGSAGRFSGNCQ